MDPTISIKDYVDARDDAVESRLSTKLDRLPGKGTIWGAAAAIVGGIFTAVAVILASLSFSSDRFNGGLSVSPILAQAQTEQARRDKDQDTRIQLMNDKLDVIIKQTASK